MTLPVDATKQSHTEKETTSNSFTDVIYAEKKNAKKVKTALSQCGLLDKRFRMSTSSANENWIAIPILQASAGIYQNNEWETLVKGRGKQASPFSSSFLGNTKPIFKRNDHQDDTMTLIQQALFDTILEFRNDNDDDNDILLLKKKIISLDKASCPRKLERIGDDQTLMLPHNAFNLSQKDCSFSSLIHTFLSGDDDDTQLFFRYFWEKLSHIHLSPRIVRKRGIDPNSPIRESGNVILWPPHLVERVSKQDVAMNDLESLPGWITVTEQGIKQSFDMTRVMFCRGNITEKMRFGQLVQANEVLLDMYAGIGYYTLPALILGMAKHVIACEWNKYAAQALRYNIFIQKQKPSIDPKRVTVWQGDCRQSILSNLDDVIRKLEGGGVDRISLGLLPSSEGGWPTAVSALRIDRGGWLHIHGNVPTIESLAWAHWTCQQLFQIVNDQRQQARGNWIVICHHIERVKSFAPKIDHYVADIFVGTRSFWKERTGISSHDCQYGVLRKTGDGSIVLEPCPQNIKPPSCALSKDGALCQKWMM